MIELEYAPKFLKKLDKLESSVRDEAVWRIERFKNPRNHKALRVHKLHGRFKDRYAFSITNKVRIIFRYENPKFASILTIDDHDVYKR